MSNETKFDLLNTMLVGMSGAGKSNGLWNLIAQLISANTPELLNVYGCDFKNAELFHLEKLKHCKAKIAIEVDEANILFDLLVKKMKKNQDELKAKGLRNGLDDESMPTTLLIIEEISELQNFAQHTSKDPEEKKMIEEARSALTNLNRLSSKGRSAKVFVWFTTQHPIKEAIPSLVKANMAVKLCWKVASPQNSHFIVNSAKAYDIKMETECVQVDPKHPEGIILKNIPFFSDNHIQEFIGNVVSAYGKANPADIYRNDGDNTGGGTGTVVNPVPAIQVKQANPQTSNFNRAVSILKHKSQTIDDVSITGQVRFVAQWVKDNTNSSLKGSTLLALCKNVFPDVDPQKWKSPVSRVSSELTA